jgi:hypothetical protein
VASSPSCNSILVEIKCINVRRNTTVFSIFLRKHLHVSALFWVGHHQGETRISEKTHILHILYIRDVESAMVMTLVVTIAHSTLHIYSYTPPQTL